MFLAEDVHTDFHVTLDSDGGVTLSPLVWRVVNNQPLRTVKATLTLLCLFVSSYSRTVF